MTPAAEVRNTNQITDRGGYVLSVCQWVRRCTYLPHRGRAPIVSGRIYLVSGTTADLIDLSNPTKNYPQVLPKMLADTGDVNVSTFSAGGCSFLVLRQRNGRSSGPTRLC